MPTIKRDDSIKTNGHINASKDAFLVAFQKPTQIYAYITLRNSKLFLQRSLSYMVNHQKPRFKNASFKIDKLLELKEKPKSNHLYTNFESEYLNLKFTNNEYETSNDISMTIKVFLVTFKHNKRKSEYVKWKETQLGNITLTNSNSFISNQNILIHASSLSYPASEQHILFLTFSVTMVTKTSSYSKGNIENESPVKKRLRRSMSIPQTSTILEPEVREILSNYTTKIPVFDRFGNCQLKDGDYELILNEDIIENSFNGNYFWTPLPSYYPISSSLHHSKQLKVKITWSKFPLSISEDFCPTPPLSMGEDGRGPVITRVCEAASKKSEMMLNGAKLQKIFYQFLYHNKTFQQTLLMNYRCPWCQLNCRSFSPLLCHLRYCHSRFNFAYIDNPNGGRIDVSLNENYDSTFSGNPQNLLLRDPKGGENPRCRINSTQFIMYRPKYKRKEINGGWFDSDADSGKSNTLQFSYGHNRQYYHTISCQPIHPSEIDYDSEAEHDPEWMRLKMGRLIDEFLDVNEGEKEIMKMWNLHCMKNNYIGKCQMLNACESFINSYGLQIMVKNLSTNFILHLTCLQDHDLLTPIEVGSIIASLMKLKLDWSQSQGK